MIEPPAVGLGEQLEHDTSDTSDSSIGNQTSQRSASMASAVVGVVLAGGQGTRLAPLTTSHAKPAVPFGARHRIIDFVLSNLVNSGVRSVYVLLQHHSRSVRDHLRSAWHTVPGNGLIQSLQSTGRPFRGTADAVRQSLDQLQAHSADYVMIFGADHVYRMDVRQMIGFHRERDADVTIAALPVPRKEAHAFGVIGCDADGRIRSFLEKPQDPPAMPGDPERAYASMGNYCFRADALIQAMHDCAEIDDLDFGRHVLPRMLSQGRRIHAYDFATNQIPGMVDDTAYWRDVGTLDAYFDATLDTLGNTPRFELENRAWPIHVAGRLWPHARVLRADIRSAHIGAGALVREAKVVRSVVRRGASIDEGAELDQCIVLDGARIGRDAKLRRVIVDRHANVPANARLGFDSAHDARSHLVTPAGITVVSAA